MTALQHNPLKLNRPTPRVADRSGPAPSLVVSTPPALVSKDQAAQMLGGISTKTLMNWVAQGKCPPPLAHLGQGPGSRVLFSYRELQEWAAARCPAQESAPPA